MEKRVVRLDLEPWEYPIFLTDYMDGTTYTGVPVIDNDEVVRELNKKICHMYGDCFEADSHGVAMWFNSELYTKICAELKSLAKQLMDRLNELNDGSFELDDHFSKWI
ncbi:MAG: hypothetical protein LUE27_10915 [Clostridia bacterium]|nr:hypothetical protein [Clostridia bacterium]